MRRSTLKLVSMLTVAMLAVSLAGCSEWKDAEPRKPASDGSSKQQSQQWNASDGSTSNTSSSGAAATSEPKEKPAEKPAGGY